MNTVPPVHREIIVDADPATAFEVFTARIGRWWPLASHSVFGAGGSVAFADKQLIERSADGQRAVWGTVTRWDPPAAVAFTWHPGKGPESASRVEVTFTAAGTQTLVALEHAGWEVYADPEAARGEYEQGWPTVLGKFMAVVGARPDGETWVALLHRPGPAAPVGKALFENPRFAEHLAFLRRMDDAGYLVAAGSLADEPGEGMTILRLPGAGQIEEATRLATQDDASVADGFLAVIVRPWHVRMRAPALTA